MCVNGTKTVGKHVGKLLAKNRTCLYSRQLFHQRFRVGKLVFDVWTIGKRVLVAFNQLKHALCSRVLRDHRKMADGLEERDTTFRFIEEVHNCPDLWDISSPAYKDTKNEQAKMEQLAEKLGLKGGK